MDEILPDYYPVVGHSSKDGKVTAVNIGSIDEPNWVKLMKETIPEPGGNKQLLVISAVGYESPEEIGEQPAEEELKKFLMDIKIGTYTKSGQQYALEYRPEAAHWWEAPAIKKLEHNLKDLWRGNRFTGYDIDKKNLAAFNAEFDKAKKGFEPNLRLAMETVLPKLDHIANVMSEAPVTFVGSSILIAFNLTRPGSSDAKLIDPDHPIITGDIEMDRKYMPESLTTSQEMSGGRDWAKYIKKWQSGYATGMTSFINWFQARIGDIPQGKGKEGSEKGKEKEGSSMQEVSD